MTIFLVGLYSTGRFHDQDGPREHGNSPSLSDLEEDGDVRLVEAEKVRRYTYETDGGRVYECDSWSGKCRSRGGVRKWDGPEWLNKVYPSGSDQ